jgi:hypothetical protein
MKLRDRLAVRASFVAAGTVTAAALAVVLGIEIADVVYDLLQWHRLQPAEQHELFDLKWRYWMGDDLKYDELHRISEIMRRYYNSPTQTIIFIRIGCILLSCTLCSVPVLVGFTKQLVPPVLLAARQARRAAQGELSARVAPLIERRQRGELAQLVEDLDALLDMVERNDRSIRDNTIAIAERLEAPVAAVHRQLQAIRGERLETPSPSMARLIAEVERLGEIVDDLRTQSLTRAGKL